MNPNDPNLQRVELFGQARAAAELIADAWQVAPLGMCAAMVTLPQAAARRAPHRGAGVRHRRSPLGAHLGAGVQRAVGLRGAGAGVRVDEYVLVIGGIILDISWL